MILLLIFCLSVNCLAEETLATDQTSSCNCSQLLSAEEPTEIYPTFPPTSFTCWGRIDGYYADVEVDCTIFHYCQTWQYPTGLNETVKWDFACPQSTIFNQKILSCTPPNISFDCKDSPSYYWVNYNLTSPTPLPSSTTEVTTPESSLGQQLIIGGLGPHSAEFSESTIVDVEEPGYTSSPTQGLENLLSEPTKPTTGSFPEPTTFTTTINESDFGVRSPSTQGFGEKTMKTKPSLRSIIFPTSESEFRGTNSYYSPSQGLEYAPIKFPSPKLNAYTEKSNFSKSEFENVTQSVITI